MPSHVEQCVSAKRSPCAAIIMRKTIFMIMPFSDAVAGYAYRYITKPVAEANGFDIQRADEIFSINPIFDDIITAIEKSSLIIVDISGRNANCFYELGVAHTMKRNRTIMITHDEFNDVPFDIAHFRILKYADSIQGKAQYELDLSKTLKTITTGLAELYYPEFDIIVALLSAMNEENTLLGALALSKFSRPIRINENIFIEGQIGESDPIAIKSSARQYFNPLISRGLVEILDDAYTVSSKGNAFNEYLTARGYRVHICCDEIFTDKYVSIIKR